jgi:hypothetical protein
VTVDVPIRSISGDTEVAGALRSRLLRLPMRSLFPMTLQNPELLPRAGADCPARRRLTKTKEQETIIINRSGRSTYPEEKSVSRSGATPGVRAVGAEEIVRPRRLIGRFCAAPQLHR